MKPLLLTCLFLGGIILMSFYIYWKNFRGVWPAVLPAAPGVPGVPGAPSTPEAVERTETGESVALSAPSGFSVRIFAHLSGGARALAQDSLGNLVASVPSNGTVVLLPDANNDGVADTVTPLVEHLNKPHGVAFACGQDSCRLFVAETDKVVSYLYDSTTLTASHPTQLISLPTGGNHWTRTIGLSPDGKLYVSLGSICNVCVEKDARRSIIFSMNTDGTDVTQVARGLRNSVFFSWQPETDVMWATEMGRDHLGDNTPPDEINIIKPGNDYGWPYCYGKNIHDQQFDPQGKKSDFCSHDATPSTVDLQAHSAPLGLAFVPKNSNWPKDYWGDLLVSFHGSWNRTVPTGYKIVRIHMSPDGSPGAIEDFISGWLSPNGQASGRPVDLLFDSTGTLYVSDDKANVIYRVTYRPPQ